MICNVILFDLPNHFGQRSLALYIITGEQGQKSERGVGFPFPRGRGKILLARGKLKFFASIQKKICLRHAILF